MDEKLPTAVIGIIGGSGVYGLEGMQNKREIEIDTPFGKPSSKIMIGELDGIRVAFLARHDVTHRLTPSEVPYRANIYALKLLGVKYLLCFSACGSLQEDIKPMDLVLCDQFIDNTRHRQQSFFGEGVVAHVSFADPVCHDFRKLAFETLSKLYANSSQSKIHNGGTYVCIEGPAFSSKAESNVYRLWGGSIIGMTAIPESKLAKEAEMSYLCVGLVTDFDCWHPEHDAVTVEMVVSNLKHNSLNAQKIAIELVKSVSKNQFESKSHNALKGAVMTPHYHIPSQTASNLEPLLKKYLVLDNGNSH
jgi:5'-methylthioadenosine phosphorylase